MNILKRIVALSLCVVLLLGCFTGCSARETCIEYVIGVSLANLNEQWRLVLKDEPEAEAQKYDSVRLVCSALLLKLSFCLGNIRFGNINPLLSPLLNLLDPLMGHGFNAAGQLIGGIFISRTR